MDVALATINYVVWEPFFWPAMAFTTIIGIFIGAVIYDGLLNEIKKMILSLTVYALIITIVNATRIIPQMGTDLISDPRKPFASMVTLVLVTVFYLLGMYIGVKMVNRAHQFPKKLPRKTLC